LVTMQGRVSGVGGWGGAAAGGGSGAFPGVAHALEPGMQL